jgi:hypothetical protein
LANTFADSNRYIARFLKEGTSTWGETPSSGTPREVRLTSSSLTASKETVVSDEIRADRMVSNVIEVQAGSAGDISTEFSSGSHDEFLEAFVLGAWTRPMSFDRWEGEQVSITATDGIAINGGDFSDYFTVGRRIKTEGFATPGNNGYFEVESVAFSSGVTTVTTVETSLTIEAASRYTKVMDANDVIVLNNTTVAAVADGFTGTGVFASAIAAGQLAIGQRIFVEGLGFEEGTYVFGSAPAAGDSVTVSDGMNSRTYQYAGTVPEGVVDLGAAADVQEAANDLAAAIQADYALGLINVKAVSDDTDTVTINNLNSEGGALTEDEAGTAITTTDFANGAAGARGFFTVSALTDDKITVSETVDAVSAGDAVTIKGSMLRNPGEIDDITPQSFTIEEHYTDIGQVFVRDGMRVGSFNEEVASGAIVTGSFSFMGRATSRRTSTLLGTSPYTPLEAPTTEVINATTNVGDLYKDGALLATAVQSISVTGEANLRAQNAVGSKFARGIGTGRFNLTGTVTAYFEDGAMYDHFVAHDTVSLAYDFQDIDGNVYWTTIPAVKFTSDDITPGGIDQDVLEPIEFTAQRDPATNCQFQRDRFSSIKAPTA